MRLAAVSQLEPKRTAQPAQAPVQLQEQAQALAQEQEQERVRVQEQAQELAQVQEQARAPPLLAKGPLAPQSDFAGFSHAALDEPFQWHPGLRAEQREWMARQGLGSRPEPGRVGAQPLLVRSRQGVQALRAKAKELAPASAGEPRAPWKWLQNRPVVTSWPGRWPRRFGWSFAEGFGAAPRAP